MRKDNGFTLIEMLVAVAILGILTAIAVPNMSSYMDSRRVVSAAEAIYSQITYARSEAIARSQNVVVNITPGASNVWAVGVSTNAACDPSHDLADASPCVLSVSGINVLKRVLGTEHTDATIASGTNTITFDPVRGTATGNGTITITHSSGNELRVIVSLLGRAKICRPNGSGKRGYSAC